MTTEVSKLVIGREGRAVAGPIDLRLAPGRLTVVRGRNGAGKSTFLRTLAGLEPVLSGEFGALPGPVARVPQAAELGDRVPIRVDEVIDLGLGEGFDRAERRGRIASALERLGITHLSRRRFGRLSSGERQRTLIARALAAEPNTLLLDEPLTNLDHETTAEVWALLEDIVEAGTLVVIVAHEELPDDLRVPVEEITLTAVTGAS